METAWQFLDHSDPWIAHAARVALEHQPAAEWARRALDESRTSRALPALMSLTRVGADEFLPGVLERLVRLQPALLSVSEKRMFLRAAEFATQRLGNLQDAPKEKLVSLVDSIVPDAAPEVNREAVRLLVALEARTAIAKGVSLLVTASNQEDKLHYLQLLGRVKAGWKDEDRVRFFRVLAQAPTFRGGAGLPKTIKQIEQDALQTIPESERPRFSAQLGAKRKPADLAPPSEARSIVRSWTMADLEGALEWRSGARNFESGKQMFAAASCVVCHQMGDEGLAVGPDLTEVASRFNRRDILDSILEPSRVISDTYETIVVTTTKGTTVAGRLALADYRLPVLRLAVNPLDPDEVVEIPKSDIASYSESEISPMPKGLLDRLQKDEILDLLAYLEAGGNVRHRNFSEVRAATGR